jgi:hypothetical protein
MGPRQKVSSSALFLLLGMGACTPAPKKTTINAETRRFAEADAYERFMGRRSRLLADTDRAHRSFAGESVVASLRRRIPVPVGFAF